VIPVTLLSNIFVDDDWNVTGGIDLEFAPVVPREMIAVPAWLTDRGVEEIEGEYLEQSSERHEEFVRFLEIEEKAVSRDDSPSQRLRRDLETGLETGKFWYVLALSAAVSRLWGENVDHFITWKLKDNEDYKVAICVVFAEAGKYVANG
ncbi:hypothetical protein E4T47_05728, partial [Aureobasidium subglaciale]